MSSRKTFHDDPAQLTIFDLLEDDVAAADPLPDGVVDLSDLPALDERFALDIYRVGAGRDVWPMFRPHHYLTGKYHGVRAWLVTTPDGDPVAFTSVMAFPHGAIKNGWRGHRTVVLPDYQGLGIGARLSDWLGEYVVNVWGGRFFSKTQHPRFGAFRERSPYWRATSSNLKPVPEKQNHMWHADTNRLCFSHEYVGGPDRRIEWHDRKE